MSVTVSATGNTQVQASTAVSKASTQLESMLDTKAPKVENAVSIPEAGITHWKKKTLSTTSYASGSGSSSKSLFRVTTGFEIKFRDFSLLSFWATTLSTTPNVTVSKISWSLTDVTKKNLETKSRKLCAEDAMTKAKDYAEALQFNRNGVKAVELEDTKTTVGSSNGHHGYGRGTGFVSSSWEEENTLSFASEEIRVHSSINVKFVVDWQ